MIIHVDPVGVLRKEFLDRGIGRVVGQVLDDLDLRIDAVSDGFAAGGGAPAQTNAGDHFLGGLQHLETVAPGAEVHEVDDGFPDDIIQGHQDGQGQEAPQAAGHGIDALFGIELLHLLLHLHLVIGVFLLDLLHLAGHPAHADHALFGLHLEGEQDQLDDQSKQDQRHAIGPGETVEQPHQSRKRITDPVTDCCHKCSPYVFRWGSQRSPSNRRGHEKKPFPFPTIEEKGGAREPQVPGLICPRQIKES